MLALFFAAIALLLAGVGPYGLLDDAVRQRQREIGIRMALGARPGAVAFRIAAQTLVMVSIGVLVGFAFACRGELHQITFTSARVDPARTLRAE